MNAKPLLIVMLLAQSYAWPAQDDLSPLVPQEVDKSSPTLSAETWVPKAKSRRPPPPPPPPVLPPAPAPPPPPAPVKRLKKTTAAPSEAAAAPGAPGEPSPYEVPLPPPRIQLNKIEGTVSSIDMDAQTIRLDVPGGYTPQLDFDANTIVAHNGKRLTMNDLQIGDHVVAGYVGKVLTARIIEKKSSAPRSR